MPNPRRARFNERYNKPAKPGQKQASHSPQREARAAPELVIMGRNTVMETVRHQPGRVERILSSAREGLSELSSIAAEHGLLVEDATAEELTALTGSSSHQSCAAIVRERPRRELREFLSSMQQKERCAVIALDSLQDPHNLGAILRAGECFGIDAVVWSRNRGVDITPVVSKVSVGASELVESVLVSNLNEALRRLKDAGFWIVAAEASPEADSIEEFEFPDKVAFVFGAEGEGIHRLVLENCDFHVAIPMRGKIDSLNVSQAVAVFLYAWGQQGKNVAI